MHEFSVASQAVDTIIEKADQKKAKRICSIEICIGELSMLNGEQFTFWIKEILNAKSSIAHDVSIQVQPIRAEVHCRQCGHNGPILVKEHDHYTPVVCCPSCFKEDIEIKKGRECILKKIQLEV